MAATLPDRYLPVNSAPDRDFDQVTTVTGQPAVWLAPAGSIN